MTWLANLGLVDLGILAVVLVSGLLALARGFAKEVLALAAWVAAAAATWYLYPKAQPFARSFFANELIADAITVAVLFVVTLVAASIVGHPVAARIREGSLGFVDRWLGFAFGVVRGGLIVTIAYVLLSWVLPAPEQPAWLRSARLVPYVQQAGEWLMRIVPTTVRDQTVLAVVAHAEERGRT